MSSRPFDARNTSGICYFCDAAGGVGEIRRGQRVLYLTARAVNGAPGRPLNRRELAEWRRLGRARKAARRGGHAQPVVPEWLWDRLVHIECARRNGFPIPGGEASPINGTRWIGVSDGVQATGRTGREESQRLRDAEARIARRAAAEAARRAAAEAARRAAAEAARRAAAEAAAEAAKEAKEAEAFERLRVDEPGAARFQLLDLDDNASRQADESDGPDPSVERFKLLDLD